MSVDSLSEVIAKLRAAGCVFAEEEAALLLAAAEEGGELSPMLARRVAGEPLELVLGWTEFGGLRVQVEPGVFVPRKRTELLAALATDLATEQDAGLVVVDLCCGTGAIGMAVAASAPRIHLHAADIDPAAVACARRNLTCGEVHQGDLFDALPAKLRGRVGLLLVNAPYVPTDQIRLMPSEARLYEPNATLDGGRDGLDVHRRTAAGAGEWLAPGGSLLLETSPRQVSGTTDLCIQAGLTAKVFGEDQVRVVQAISASGALLAQ